MIKRKKAYSRPKKPWDAKRILEENSLVREYGLKKKIEIWRAAEMLRKWREIAKTIVGLSEDKKDQESRILLTKLQRYGIVTEKADIDDVLALSLRDVLEKRLQTIVYKKKLAITPNQARQFIVHNKIIVNGEKISSPSYLVKVSDEISYVVGFKPNLIKEEKQKEVAEVKENG